MSCCDECPAHALFCPRCGRPTGRLTITGVDLSGDRRTVMVHGTRDPRAALNAAQRSWPASGYFGRDRFRASTAVPVGDRTWEVSLVLVPAEEHAATALRDGWPVAPLPPTHPPRPKWGEQREPISARAGVGLGLFSPAELLAELADRGLVQDCD